MNRLEGKVCVVTGAARGIGKGIALRFLEEGAKVWICDVNATGIEASVEELSSNGDVAGGVTDVIQRDQMRALVEGVVAHWGTLDVMVNNAGIAHHASFLEIDDANWDRILDVNLRSSEPRSRPDSLSRRPQAARSST